MFVGGSRSCSNIFWFCFAGAGRSVVVVMSNDGIAIFQFGESASKSAGGAVVGHRVQLPPNAGDQFSAVAIGGHHAIVVMKNSVWALASVNSDGQAGTGHCAAFHIPRRVRIDVPVSKVTCGARHTVFL